MARPYLLLRQSLFPSSSLVSNIDSFPLQLMGLNMQRWGRVKQIEVLCIQALGVLLKQLGMESWLQSMGFKIHHLSSLPPMFVPNFYGAVRNQVEKFPMPLSEQRGLSCRCQLWCLPPLKCWRNSPPLEVVEHPDFLRLSGLFSGVGSLDAKHQGMSGVAQVVVGKRHLLGK